LNVLPKLKKHEKFFFNAQAGNEDDEALADQIVAKSDSAAVHGGGAHTGHYADAERWLISFTDFCRASAGVRIY
jgi:hypothetical protein